MKPFTFAFLGVVLLAGLVPLNHAHAKKPAVSYTLECVLRSGCDFTCVAAPGPKPERIFEKRNVRTVDFIEFNGAAIATIFVSNERPTTFRISGSVFCQLPNSMVR